MGYTAGYTTGYTMGYMAGDPFTMLLCIALAVGFWALVMLPGPSGRPGPPMSY